MSDLRLLQSSSCDVRTTVVRHILLRNRAIMARMWRDNSGNPATVHKFKINTDEIYSLLCDYKTLFISVFSLDFVFLLYRFRWILFSFRFVSFRFSAYQYAFILYVYPFNVQKTQLYRHSCFRFSFIYRYFKVFQVKRIVYIQIFQGLLIVLNVLLWSS